MIAIPATADTTHLTKLVAEIQPPQIAHDCVYFRLAGVMPAETSMPGNAYFAMPRTQVGFKEIYSLLLSAYLSDNTVSVRTTGAAVGGECGNYVGITWLISP